MFAKRVRAAAIGTAFGLVGLFGSVGSAQAAVYAGHWDPIVGGQFADLGWDASAIFSVPDSCLAAGTATFTISQCPGFAVLSAQLDFYNKADPSDILQSFNFLPTSPSDVVSVNITGFGITDGQLTSVKAGYFASVVPSGDWDTIAGGGDYAFALTLLGTQAGLAYISPTDESPACTSPDAANPGDDCGFSARSEPGTFIAVVPEPETYALMFAGLGMMGFIARRRKS
jgi:hypothetical protein